ncbi:MAG: hypothetical protein KGI05_00380 [Thaumarchaeota archaeon]|nr:hypothetical protein [Nitrososphaerota archaeon]
MVASPIFIDYSNSESVMGCDEYPPQSLIAESMSLELDSGGNPLTLTVVHYFVNET